MTVVEPNKLPAQNASAWPTPGSNGCDACPPKGSPPPSPKTYIKGEAKTEFSTELTPGGRWEIRLQAIDKFLVWDMTYVAPYPVYDHYGMRNQPTAGSTYSYANPWASAIVDARTGDIIRLTRPSKTTVTFIEVAYDYPYGSPMPNVCQEKLTSASI